MCNFSLMKMKYIKWLVILIAGVIVLVLLNCECKNAIRMSKFRVRLPYREEVLEKEKYGLSEDAIIYNELTLPPERFFGEPYKCEVIRRHLYNKFQGTVGNCLRSVKSIQKLHSPINSIFNRGINVRNSVDIYGNGSDEHTYFIRAAAGDYNEIFIYDDYVYVS